MIVDDKRHNIGNMPLLIEAIYDYTPELSGRQQPLASSCNSGKPPPRPLDRVLTKLDRSFLSLLEATVWMHVF